MNAVAPAGRSRITLEVREKRTKSRRMMEVKNLANDDGTSSKVKINTLRRKSSRAFHTEK